MSVIISRHILLDGCISQSYKQTFRVKSICCIQWKKRTRVCGLINSYNPFFIISEAGIEFTFDEKKSECKNIYSFHDFKSSLNYRI